MRGATDASAAVFDCVGASATAVSKLVADAVQRSRRRCRRRAHASTPPPPRYDHYPCSTHVSLNDLSVSLCRLETAMRAASCEGCGGAGERVSAGGLAACAAAGGGGRLSVSIYEREACAPHAPAAPAPQWRASSQRTHSSAAPISGRCRCLPSAIGRLLARQSPSAAAALSHQRIIGVRRRHRRRGFGSELIQLAGGHALVHAGGDLLRYQHLSMHTHR